jgi:hypothetical protein
MNFSILAIVSASFISLFEQEDYAGLLCWSLC